MKWYKFDFDKYQDDVYGLPDAEDLAYRRLMDLYYRSEAPLPADHSRLERYIALDWECIEPVLLRFFVLKDSEVWVHEDWQADIDHRKRRAAKNAVAGKIGGKAKKRLRTKVDPK